MSRLRWHAWGCPQLVWPLLCSSPDNSVRSYIIDRWGQCGASAEILVERIEQSQRADEKRALLLALASIPETLLPIRDRELLLAHFDIFGQFEHAKDAGIHSGAALAAMPMEPH